MLMEHMFARKNTEGVSVNESSVCIECLEDGDALEASYNWWACAEDVNADNDDDSLYSADNPDGRCNGCFRGIDS